MTLSLIARLAIGYIAASCAAACIIVIALLFFGGSQGPAVIDLEFVLSAALMGAFIAGSVAVLAFVPSLLAAVYAERNAINSLRWYVVAGAVVGLVALSLNLALIASRGGITLSDLSDHPVLTSSAGITTIVMVAGICAGYTFWLVAGRYAGRP